MNWNFAVPVIGLILISSAASAEDEVAPTPKELRAQAETLERAALDGLLMGHKDEEVTLTPSLAAKLAKSYREEADLREKSEALSKEAEKLASAGKTTEAKKQRSAAAQARIEAEAMAAERIEDQRLRERRVNLRDDLLFKIEKAAAFRREGNSQEAAKLEAEAETLLQQAGYNKRLKRVHELKQMAIDAMLEGRSEDANLFTREANQLLPAEATLPLSSHSSRLSAPSELQQLRSDVDRLTQQVKLLTEAVKVLAARQQ